MDAIAEAEERKIEDKTRRETVRREAAHFYKVAAWRNALGLDESSRCVRALRTHFHSRILTERTAR